MSYLADTREEFATKKCDGAPGNFACARLVSADDFGVRRGKKQRISHSLNSRTVAAKRRANSHRKKFSSQAFIRVRGWTP